MDPNVNLFFASPFFRFFVFPLASAVLGIYVKYVTRNDQFSRFRKEDLAIGLDLMRIAGLMYLLLISDRAITLARLSAMSAAQSRDDLQEIIAEAAELSEGMSAAGWVIAAYIFSLWSVSTVVRKLGWETDTRLRPIIAIAFPFVVGIGALLLVMLGASR